MRTNKNYIEYAVAMAHCVHKRLTEEERLIPILLDDILKYRKDIHVRYADLGDLDGCSAYYDKKDEYLIIINNTFDVKRQRFTLSHELGHIFLKHHTKNKDLDEFIKEDMADSFAGELLMPKQMMFKTANYPINYVLESYFVSKSAYRTRLNFLKRFYNLDKVVEYLPVTKPREFIQLTKLRDYL